VTIEVLPGEKKGIIRDILPRQTRLVRKAVGKKFFEQVIASNIDYLFITQSLDSDFSVRRTERYAAACVEGGIIPVLLLTKSDLCPDSAAKKAEAARNMPGLKSIVMSIKTGEGMDELKSMLELGKTYAFAGSSGVGKSSLINALAGEALLYSTPVREKDQKGRHTTVAREIIIVKPGWLLLDTPGMREMAPWDAEDGVNLSFADVEEIILKCRFSDCTHTSEKGCAVQEAIKEGKLDEKRLQSYIKLIKEQEYLARKKNTAAAVLEKQKWKTIHKNAKKMMQDRERRRFED
jgi:ribosome biogenesis GTPase